MSEVDGKDLFLEAINIKDGEVGSLLVPGDNLKEAIVLNLKKGTSRISKVLEIKIEGPLIF